MPSIQPLPAGNPADAAPTPARISGKAAGPGPFDAALREAGAKPAGGTRTSADAQAADRQETAGSGQKNASGSGQEIASGSGGAKDETKDGEARQGAYVAHSDAEAEPRPLDTALAGLTASPGDQGARAPGGDGAAEPDGAKTAGKAGTAPVTGSEQAAQAQADAAPALTGAAAAQSGKAQAEQAAAQTAKADTAPPSQSPAQAQSGKVQGEKAAAQADKPEAGTSTPQAGGSKPEGAAQAGLEAEAEAQMQASAANRDGRGRAEQSVAERAAGGQARGELRTGKAEPLKAGGEARAEARTDAKAAIQALSPSPAGPAAAARPLAELIAFQLQQAPAAAPILIEGAAGMDTSGSPDGELGVDTGQMRAEARGEALRTPAQAGQPARFTPHTVQHLAARIAQTASGGGRTVDIRLDPPELGRVQVRLEMGADNSVRAMLSAERVDTLAELQRTARDLEKALAEAGLDLAENGLEFSLSQNGADSFEGGGRFTPVFAEIESAADPAAGPSPDVPPALYGFALFQRARLDVRI